MRQKNYKTGKRYIFMIIVGDINNLLSVIEK